jgi:hypothetical protein
LSRYCAASRQRLIAARRLQRRHNAPHTFFSLMQPVAKGRSTRFRARAPFRAFYPCQGQKNVPATSRAFELLKRTSNGSLAQMAFWRFDCGAPQSHYPPGCAEKEEPCGSWANDAERDGRHDSTRWQLGPDASAPTPRPDLSEGRASEAPASMGGDALFLNVEINPKAPVKSRPFSEGECRSQNLIVTGRRTRRSRQIRQGCGHRLFR